MIATGIAGAPTTAGVAQLANLLNDHPSGYVRSVGAQHLTHPQANHINRYSPPPGLGLAREAGGPLGADGEDERSDGGDGEIGSGEYR